MKRIQAGSKIIELNVGEELVVRDFKKISPFLADTSDGFALISNIVGALAIDKESAIGTLDDMTMDEFKIVSDEISTLISIEKKTKA